MHLKECESHKLHQIWVMAVDLEYGFLENGSLEANLISKNTAIGFSKKNDGNLEFNLENGHLEK